MNPYALGIVVLIVPDGRLFGFWMSMIQKAKRYFVDFGAFELSIGMVMLNLTDAPFGAKNGPIGL